MATVRTKKPVTAAPHPLRTSGNWGLTAYLVSDRDDLGTYSQTGVVASYAHEARRAGLVMKEACPSVHSHASEAPVDLDDPSDVDVSPNVNQLLVHLPEELILVLLSHLEKRDCLSCACVSRALNRIAIPYLLTRCGVKKPGSYCKLILDPLYKSNIDPLLALQHSIFIKEIKDLSFYFTRFSPYNKLSPPLLRCLHLLRTLTHVEEVTLFFSSSKGNTKLSKDEKHIKEMVPIYEDLLNEIVLKSSKKIRVFGSDGLLGQFYDFRKESPSGKPSGGNLKSPTRLLSGVKDYFDRRQQHKKTDDPVILDDLRYSRSTLTGSRIFLRCSPEALKQTQLTHLNIGTADFLRPPFSQWFFSMLQASNIQSLSFAFSHLPEDNEEVEFILQRLASVIPNLNRLYLFDIKPEVLSILIKWINMFANLQTLQIEPFIDVSDENFAELLETSNSTLPDAKDPPSTQNTTTSGLFSFAPHLRRIDAPHQFLTYFATISSSPPSPPSEKDDQVSNGPKPQFPSLDMVHLDYYCIKHVKFDPHILANALRRIRPVLLPSPAAGGTSKSGSSSASIVVHLKFDTEFLGLAAAGRRVPGANDNTDSDADSKTQIPDAAPQCTTDTDDPASVPVDTADAAPEIDIAADIFELSKIEKLRLGLPGKRDDILQGKFDDKILILLSLFKGLRNVRLASSESAISKVKEELSPLHSRVFKEGRPALRKVEVI
ncbi:hypothetical protein EST38_g2337 [Candolleomyces aberdarensis]|uniref:F-box domain-containing protein n=1 Tax=Candolleomyces aberdarensis TaxID=2316362 RepID=A0A4Q2DT43_9AGAR|nr:hypothetical protein EST38_g2337 [Candolleomyces aberdarensis]